MNEDRPGKKWLLYSLILGGFVFLGFCVIVAYNLGKFFVGTTGPTQIVIETPEPTVGPSTPTTRPATPSVRNTPRPADNMLPPATSMGREVFNDLNPETQLLELWRIEHDWQVTAKLAYHFQDPFSFDGRYIVSQQGEDLHIFDLQTDRVIKVLEGGNKPTWARHSRQIFYYDAHRIYRYDIDKDETVVIVHGIGAGFPRTISYDDRYIFTGYGGFPDGQDRNNTGEIYRIENTPEASLDNGKVVPLTHNWQYASEPRASSRYNIIVFKQRRSSAEIEQGWWAMPFDGLLTENRKAAKLLDKDFRLGTHAAWLGDGEYFIMGNDSPPRQIRYLGNHDWGKWKAIGPTRFPAGDVAPLGYSGRWLVADAPNEAWINVVDVETGRPTLLAYDPSEIIDNQPGDENKGDPNPHGSPDGTKVAFVSNYDFKNCPITQLTAAVSNNVPVLSTVGFPPTGVLAIRHHLIAYTSKTPQSFEGVTIGVLDTESAVEGTWPGMGVSNFACRSASVTDLDHQYQQDLYIAVYRLPDIPHLSVSESVMTITPGENHREIMGYKLHGPTSSILITSFPTRIKLSQGEYSVSALEWSRLESPLSNFVTVSIGAFKVILED